MPTVAFLGVCDRASYTRQGPFVVQNILGLRSHIVSFIYPLGTDGLNFVFAFYDPANVEAPCEIRFLAPDGTVALSLSFRFECPVTTAAENAPPPNAAGPFLFPSSEPLWVAMSAKISPAALILHPGLYRAVLPNGEQVGVLNCILVEPAPLSEDRIAAIRADPRASKFIQFKYECNACNDTMQGYVSLDRNQERERAGTIWYTDLPAAFVCKCGKSKVDLAIVKRNLHGLLGAPFGEFGNMSIVPMYEKSTLETTASEFAELFQRDCSEEEIQQYITDHPVLLAPFSPQRIRFKSPILSKFKTDITVLDRTGRLLFIELEKSSKKLLTKSGDETSDLQHALRQVRDWLHEAQEHRQAALDCLDILPGEVVSIETVVIIGRDKDHDPKRLRWLKGVDHGRNVRIWTYDDLLHAFDAVMTSLGKA